MKQTSKNARLADYIFIRIGSAERNQLERLAGQEKTSMAAVARRFLLRGLLADAEPEEQQQSEERT